MWNEPGKPCSPCGSGRVGTERTTSRPNSSPERTLTLRSGSRSSSTADRLVRRLFQVSQLSTSEGGAQHSFWRASQRTWHSPQQQGSQSGLVVPRPQCIALCPRVKCSVQQKTLHSKATQQCWHYHCFSKITFGCYLFWLAGVQLFGQGLELLLFNECITLTRK